MKDLRRSLAFVSLLVLLLSGCGGSRPAQTPSEDEKEYTFTDALGRTVTVTQPERVAAAEGSLADAWQLAGGTLYAVTSDAFSEDRGLELPETPVDLGSVKTPNAEVILANEIDFVILSADLSGHVGLRETLEAARIPCAYFDVEDFEDYLSMLRIFTDITGRHDLYEQNGTAVEAQIDAAVARAQGQQGPRVLLLRAYSGGVKAKGSDNLAGAMLSRLGCLNIADTEESLLEDLSLEKILLEDPDFIFVTTMGDSEEKALESFRNTLALNPAWAGLSAVEQDRCVLLPKALFHYKPNARWGESYEFLADILYPA